MKVLMPSVIITLGRNLNMDKLTMHELTKRLDNEFEDIDLTIHTSPTKGTVAVVYFYEDKLEDNEDD